MIIMRLWHYITRDLLKRNERLSIQNCYAKFHKEFICNSQYYKQRKYFSSGDLVNTLWYVCMMQDYLDIKEF